MARSKLKSVCQRARNRDSQLSSKAPFLKTFAAKWWQPAFGFLQTNWNWIGILFSFTASAAAAWAISVPAFHAGARVAIEALGGTIRTGNLILAQHPRCLIRDARVEDPLHVKERRELSILPAPPAPQRAPLFAFDHVLEVEARPLSF